MSKPIFERYVDERGNISVRVSQDMIVLTQEEAERIEAEYKRMQTENAKLREELEAAKHDLQVFSMGSVQLEAENAKLREQMERLVTLLRVDCDIDASWDGLRRFWSIELTEGGCLMRDRACKAEADNAKLREQVDAAHMSRLLTENENESLRELVRDIYTVMVEDAANCDVTYPEQFDDRMRELGVDE